MDERRRTFWTLARLAIEHGWGSGYSGTIADLRLLPRKCLCLPRPECNAMFYNRVIDANNRLRERRERRR